MQPPKGTVAYAGFTKGVDSGSTANKAGSVGGAGGKKISNTKADGGGGNPAWKGIRDSKLGAPRQYQRDPVNITKADSGHYQSHHREAFSAARSQPRGLSSAAGGGGAPAEKRGVSSTTSKRRGSNDSQASGDSSSGAFPKSPTNNNGTATTSIPFGASPLPKPVGPPGPSAYYRPDPALSPSVSVEGVANLPYASSSLATGYTPRSTTHFSNKVILPRGADGAVVAAGTGGMKRKSSAGVHHHSPHQTYEVPKSEQTTSDQYNTTSRNQFPNRSSSIDRGVSADRYSYRMSSREASLGKDQYVTTHSIQFSPQRKAD